MASCRVLLPFVFVLIVLGTQACCRDGWTLFQGSCYGYGRAKVSWGEAAAYCLSTGAHLAVIETNQENDFLRKMAKDNNDSAAAGTWIGGTDVFSDGKWVWMSSGKSFGPFTDWVKGQPDNSRRTNGVEHCLFLWKEYGYRWNDGVCSVLLNFICEGRSV